MSTSPQEWDELVNKHASGHFLQTTHWARVKSHGLWSHELVCTIATNGTLEAGASLLFRKLPLGAGVLAYAPRGPVVDWASPAQRVAVLAAMRSVAQARGAIALLIEPVLPDTAATVQLLSAHGFQRAEFSVQPPTTILVDLRDTDEKGVLARMHPKTRYNINLSARKGVTVREGTSNDLARFYAVYETTSARKQFGIHSLEYYRNFLDECAWGERPNSVLLLAEHDSAPGEVLAAIIVTAVAGTGTYLYGASGNTLRNLMPTYALQWAGMQWSRAHGCHTYDMWGIPDVDEATLEAQYETRTEGLWGVYRTKRGYGGEIRRFTGVWVQPMASVRWQIFEMMRKRRALQIG